MQNSVRKTILTAAAIALIPIAAYAQDTELARLRRENIRLRAKVDSLQRLVGRDHGGISSLDYMPDEYNDGFYSVISVWDEFEDDMNDFGYTYGSNMVPLSKVDTLLRIPEDDVVRRYINIYTVGKARNMVSILRRYDQRLPRMRAVFKKYGVPEELTLLAIVESAMNPKARSHAGAVGLWQLMPDAARQYGLKVNDTVDERLDPDKATVAAARILADAKKRFGDWGPAVMSYNCGAGRMQRVINECGEDVTYEDMYRRLPRETRDYLPALVAAMFVNANRLLLFPPEQ